MLLGSRPRGLLLGRVQDLEDAQLHPSVEALAAPAPEDQIHYRVKIGVASAGLLMVFPPRQRED